MTISIEQSLKAVFFHRIYCAVGEIVATETTLCILAGVDAALSINLFA